jgi:Zn-dependent protease with chaperone function
MSQSEAVLRVLPFVALAFAPLWLTRWCCRRMGVAGSDPAMGWFGFNRALGWIRTGMWFAWLGGVLLLEPWRNLAQAFGWNPLAQILLHAFLTVLVPAVVLGTCDVMAYPVMKKVRAIDLPRKEVITDAFMSRLWLSLPAALMWAGLAAAPLSRADLPPSLLLSAVGMLTFMCMQFFWLRKRVKRVFNPQSLTVGPLRDQAFAMAEKAGIKLNQIYVFPTAKWRLANAYASEGNKLLLTDWLLQHLDVREINAVIGHELAHMKLRHPSKLSWLLALFVIPPVAWIRFHNEVPDLAWIVLWLLGSWKLFKAISAWVSRRYERQADSLGLTIAGDPEAFITALTRIGQLNLMPHELGRLDENLATHPSTLNRLKTIARAANISDERLKELIHAPTAVKAAYELPESVQAAARGEGPVFDSTTRQKLTVRYTGSYVLSIGAPPVILAWLVTWFPPAGYLWLPYGAAALLYFLGVALIPHWASVRLKMGLRQKIAERLFGLNHPQAGIFIGLSPGEEMRLFEGSFDWDLGFLFIEKDRLCYIGEQTRFALERNQVLRVKVGPSAPRWMHLPRICLEWADSAAQKAGTLSLAPVGKEFFGNRRQIFDLLEALEQWHKPSTNVSSVESPSSLGPLAAPQFGEVTGKPLGGDLHPVRFLSTFLLCLTPAIGILSGSELNKRNLPAVEFALLAVLAGHAFATIPQWRYRVRRGNVATSIPAGGHLRWWTECAVGLLILGAVFCGGWLWLNPWSRLNCSRNYLDANTGRIRKVRYVLFVKVTDQVQETACARAWRGLFGEYPNPDWKLEAAYPGFGRKMSSDSPYKGYFISQALLSSCFHKQFFTEAEQRAILRSYTTFLKNKPAAASDYCFACWNFVLENETNLTINVPVWLLDTNAFLSYQRESQKQRAGQPAQDSDPSP